MNVDVNNLVRESLKLKGSLDVKKDTAKKLKELEKKGVQINLLIVNLIENIDLDRMLNELSKNTKESNSEDGSVS